MSVFVCIFQWSRRWIWRGISSSDIKKHEKKFNLRPSDWKKNVKTFAFAKTSMIFNSWKMGESFSCIVLPIISCTLDDRKSCFRAHIDWMSHWIVGFWTWKMVLNCTSSWCWSPLFHGHRQVVFFIDWSSKTWDLWKNWNEIRCDCSSTLVSFCWIVLTNNALVCFCCVCFKCFLSLSLWSCQVIQYLFLRILKRK